MGNMEKKKEYGTIQFNTLNGNEYLYDSVTNCIFATDEIINDCISGFENNTSEEVERTLVEKYGDNLKVRSAVRFVSKMIEEKHAFFRDDEWIRREEEHLYDFSEEDVKSCLYDFCAMEQLTLGVTEDCNLRCKYCFYSSAYENTRNRTNNMMSEEIALKSLDYYFERMMEIRKKHPGKIAAITFYGGEPLMNFELIKKSVQHIKDNYPYRYELYITTNGLLLSGKRAEFLHDNNFNIAISLDGNKENHDRNRVTESGGGSFDVIYRNIKAFQEKYPNYPKLKLMGVYDYATTLKNNNDYFKCENLPQYISVNPVISKDTDYYDKFSQDDVNRFIGEFNESIISYLEKKTRGYISTEYTDIIIEKMITVILIRLGADDKKYPFLPYTSTCVPGTKIFVTNDGDFQICEKMEFGKNIGSYKEGLDYSKIVNITKEYNRTVTKDCKKCPVYRICPYCFSTTGTEDSFEAPDCTKNIANAVMQLGIAVTALEYNPKAFEYFSCNTDRVFDI